MSRFRRRPFVDLVERQLRLFAEEHAGLSHDCDAALRAYNAAPADQSEERYGDFLDVVDTGKDLLEEIRDTYAQTLSEAAATEYCRAFNELARKRFPRFALELE
jgi:hypothetical protein